MVKASVFDRGFLNNNKMKIILLKDHNGWPVATEQDVTPELANYLVRCGVADYSGAQPTEPKQVKPKAPAKPRVAKQNKQVKPKLEKK